MKKIISMVLSFILILGCSTTAFAAETHNYDTENLPHDGADYFETEIKADEENEERISDFVTVYGYQYTKGSLKSGAWRNGTSGGSVTDLMSCHGFAHMNCHQIDWFSVISQPHRAAA